MLLLRRDLNGWCEAVPEEIRRDTLWRIECYRLALFLSDAAREDFTSLRRSPGMRRTAEQLLDAVNSISANIAEGYGRLGARDRVRFYEYAFASARESRDWYFKARTALGPETTEDRMDGLTQVIRLLYTMIRSQRPPRADAR